MKTLFEKIWEKHVVRTLDNDTDVLFIDRHYIHEVTSPQAFDALRAKHVSVFRPELTIATADHNVPTMNQHLPIENPQSATQVDRLRINCKEQGITLFDLGDEGNGIVHIIGPESGYTLPGMTIVCGDSHTSTHGAFGTIAFGIGTSQVAQVLAAQCLIVKRPKTMRIQVNGVTKPFISAKDIILHIIKSLGTDFGTGYFIEYTGDAIKALSMEGRMTICNMSIEMGARGGLIEPDEKTQEYLFRIPGCSFVIPEDLRTDCGADFDRVVEIDASDIDCTVTYGTNPGMGCGISAMISDAKTTSDQKALAYMGIAGRDHLEGLEIQHVFIGSCTNGRIEDFEAVAQLVKGRKKADHVNALLVPGSNKVLAEIVEKGLDKIFEAAGFSLRQPGCSACLAMNGDVIPAGEYCVSTSNRNFEGRQGPGARTILASPSVAAASAIEGKLIHPNKYI